MPTVSNENTYVMKLSTFYKEFLNTFYKSFKGISLIPLFGVFPYHNLCTKYCVRFRAGCTYLENLVPESKGAGVPEGKTGESSNTIWYEFKGWSGTRIPQGDAECVAVRESHWYPRQLLRSTFSGLGPLPPPCSISLESDTDSSLLTPEGPTLPGSLPVLRSVVSPAQACGADLTEELSRKFKRTE